MLRDLIQVGLTVALIRGRPWTKCEREIRYLCYKEKAEEVKLQ